MDRLAVVTSLICVALMVNLRHLLLIVKWSALGSFNLRALCNSLKVIWACKFLEKKIKMFCMTEGQGTKQKSILYGPWVTSIFMLIICLIAGCHWNVFISFDVYSRSEKQLLMWTTSVCLAVTSDKDQLSQMRGLSSTKCLCEPLRSHTCVSQLLFASLAFPVTCKLSPWSCALLCTGRL